ncbi:DinB family protein [Paenibacillus guangzhouensis]|uniref:DinB family protein n=1 Tax=Paenibacillus guangzhouensis TaxID=1473112 RepID=UPI001267465C|nr:DinB family protein [Paenibacillus guangzhouensis]
MRSLIEEYGRGHAMLREAIEGLTEEELRFKPSPEQWSIHQIIIHVTDSEISSTHRIRRVLAEDEPVLVSFDQNAFANHLSYDLSDREHYLLLFQMLRSSMQPILEHLTEEQIKRVGVYEDAGRFTFEQLLEYRVQHIQGHIEQIGRVREAYRQSERLT